MSQFPLAKLKRIAKFDPQVKVLTAEAANAIGLACELFVAAMAEEAHKQAVLGKRKTIKGEDVEACIAGVPWMEFLDGCFEGWLDAKEVSAINDGDEEDAAEDQEDEAADGDEMEVEEIPQSVDTESLSLRLEDSQSSQAV